MKDPVNSQNQVIMFSSTFDRKSWSLKLMLVNGFCEINLKFFVTSQNIYIQPESMMLSEWLLMLMQANSG